ncbi:MAG: hypothetical protein V3V01_04220 [Acidimicrobiales bacterium]
MSKRMVPTSVPSKWPVESATGQRRGGIGSSIALLVPSALGVQGVVFVGADSGESKTESWTGRDVRDVIRGLERDLVVANRERLARELELPVSHAELRLLRVLRIVALVATVMMSLAIVVLWRHNAVLAMALIPVSPVLLLGLVLGCEQIVTRGNRYSAKHP